MIEWYYKNRQGNYFEIVYCNADTLHRTIKKQFFAYSVTPQRKFIEEKVICRLDFVIERIFLREFSDDILDKIFLRWGAPIFVNELEKENPRKEFKFTTYNEKDFDFNKDNWVFKFPKPCDFRKKENEHLICSIDDESESNSKYTSFIACESCVVPDDFTRCKYLMSHTNTKEKGKVVKNRNSCYGDCLLHKVIPAKEFCFTCQAREPIVLTIDSFEIPCIVEEIIEAKEIEMDEIKELQKKRFQFLKRLYELTEGIYYKWFNMWEIGKECEIDEKTILKILPYLKSEGLIDLETSGATVSITHLGVKEIEEALSNPDQPTQHFQPINLIIGNISDSQIIQGSPQATQIVTINQNDCEKIKEVLQEIKDSIDKFGLELQQKNDLNAEIKTVEAQLGSSQPKRVIVSESLKSIRNILEGITANVVASGLLVKLMPLINALNV